MSGAVISIKGHQPRCCDECDGGVYRRVVETQKFPYGEGSARVDLTAEIPVWRCDGCDDAFTDHEAEEARHAAVCAHLGRLNPAQLIALRQRHDMSQDSWAEHVRIGVASIKRWETGSLIQGASHDAYLRLLNDPIAYARHLAVQRTLAAAGPPVFRSQFSPAERAEARSFQLRRHG
ncbi:MAG: YgiT-type zinc finger protein [Brevundimonas sp.]|uniref:YgiT-type zinc finger protein n=1 Tax=Brevundimonas sp. TaxID=1871086 RepID=UPI001A2568FF|nr:YgiT-type zinc finger protein [Brevundimonas sp.]MBJ7320491.1 YgiT-type zinc finger protein [Brevundimonas sp.]